MRSLSPTYITESKLPSRSERDEEAVDDAPGADQCHGH